MGLVHITQTADMNVSFTENRPFEVHWLSDRSGSETFSASFKYWLMFWELGNEATHSCETHFSVTL